MDLPSEASAPSRSSAREFLVVVAYAALFSIYTAIVLALTDTVLSLTLSDYQYSGRYSFGLLTFFVAGTLFTYFGRWRGWNNWRYFVIGALGIFFPLVFLASTLRLFMADDGSMIQSYAISYCDSATLESVCGEAFAASVFTMSLRALPTVLTAPALYWYLLFHRASRRQEQQK